MTQAFSQSKENPTLAQCHSMQSCALNNLSSRKRLFVRKPGPSHLPLPAEKHRKNHSEHVEAVQTSRPSCSQGQTQQSSQKEESKTIRMQRHTQYFKKQFLDETSFASAREVTQNPRRSAVDLLLGLKYIQRPTEQNNGQNINNKRKNPVMCIGDLQTQQTTNLDDTSDNSLRNESRNVQTMKTLTKMEDEIYYDPTRQLKNLIKGASYMNLADTNDSAGCPSCKNLKKTNQFLSQKCAKLEKQLQFKSEDIKMLSDKIETLEEQRQRSRSEEAKMREETYIREMQIYQECSARYENIRKQLSRVVQRVKYLEIENGVLVRYKQDCFQAKKDYDKIKQQNDSLKKQMSTICRMGQKYNGKRPNVEVGRKQYAVGKSPYFRMNKQQDTISLELSEASYDHI